MKKFLIGAAMALLTFSASATTYTPVQLLNPAGSTAGQMVVSGGTGTAPVWSGAPAITGGSISGADASAANVTATGGVARTLAAHFSDVVYARDRGVKCDAFTDDTSAINALTLSPVTKTEIRFPAGVCVISGKVTFNATFSRIAGAAGLGTQFLYTGPSTTTDIVYIPNANNTQIEDIGVVSNTTMTGGAAFHVYKSSYTWLKNVTAIALVSNSIWNGLWIDQPNYVSVNKFYFQVQNDALAVSALGVGTGFQYDVFINDGKLANSAIGLHVGGGVDNVHADNVEATTNTINFADDNAISAFKNQEIYLGPNFVADQAQTYNYYINDSLCNTTNYGIVSISGIATNAGRFGAFANADNINVNSFPACQLVVKSPLITAASRDGIRINDTSAILSISPSTLITGNSGNGINATAAYSNLKSQGQVYGNTAGQFSANVTQAPLSASTINGVTSVSVGGVALKPVLSATTASIGGSALSAGACATGTVTVTGATGTMTALASPASGTDPGTNFTVRAFVNGLNSAAVYVCAITAGTPTATTYNVRVLQ
ncbi:hypothetical protein [Burkholderia cenocepacia]|uniref:hypothetical protein n=1 Tax=Burkholderia cenocepacia TaxID=95486 RepID=UPI001CF29872|nr:hypothetical protein [Burkholderia cenocepacia]MCA8237773.1 hypothetical protein [Burkholderia cenocepacia]